MEPALLMFARSLLGRINTRSPEKIINPTSTVSLIDHPDAVVVKDGEPIEAKSQSIYSEEKWGDEGTDQVPDRVILQCGCHILCNDTDICHVPADVAYRGFLMFMVKRDKDIIGRIVEKCDEFWNKYVKTNTPPPNTLPSPETIRRLIRVPKKTISIPNGAELVRARQEAAARSKEAGKVFEVADLALKAALGDAEAGTFDGGMATYFQYHRKAEEKIREAYDYRSIKIVKER